jgi:lauroyl/myristoyl acyltransferase
MRKHILDKPRLYQWTLHLARTLPRPLLYGLARLVGGLVYLFSSKDRTALRHNLQIAFNGAGPQANHAVILWKVFQNYAVYMVDFFRLLNMDLADSRRCAQLYEGRRHLDEALAQGCGVILLTAHLGNWEIGGMGLRALGYPVTVVTLKHNSAFTNHLINTMRSRHGIRVIELGISAYDGIEMIRALQRQEVIAVLGDRVFADRAGTTTLFGRKVLLPLGPVLLSMATGAPIVPAFSVMDAPGCYRGIIEPALEIHRGPDRKAALQHNLRQVARVFEQVIRRFPDQWYQIDRL